MTYQREPDPCATLKARGTDRYLEARDPMLAHALEAHGREWRPDLQARLDLRRDDAQGLPGVELTTLEHSIEWPDGTGRAVFRQWWISRESRWNAEMHMHPIPDTLANALEGRSLTDVVGAPGAGAWRVAAVEVVPGVHTRLSLTRE